MLAVRSDILSRAEERTVTVEVTDEMVETFSEAWEAERIRIGRGIAPAGTKTRAGLRAVFALIEDANNE